MSTRKKNSKRGGKQASSSAKKPLLLTIPARPAPPIEAPGSQDTVQPGTPAALIEHGEHPLDDAPSLVPSPSSAPSPSAVSEIPEEVQVAEEPASEPEKLPEKEAMTRVKSAKTTALDKVFQDISSSSDSEKGDSLPPVTKRGPGRKKPAAPAEDEHDETSQRLILLIPRVSGAGDKRKILPLSASYMDALSEIYTIIGCTQVRRKPELTYRLSTRPGKSTPIDLGCEEDWQGLCDEVAEGQRCKKATIQVAIIVSDSYMNSLRKHVNERKSSAQLSGSKNSKKSKTVALMDLDADDDDDDDAGRGDELLVREAELMRQLERSLSRCQLCGPQKFCCISRSGEHVNLSHQQRCGWVVALAHGTHGITLTSPPKSELFRDFHNNSTTKTPAQPSTPATQVFMPPQLNPAAMNPYLMAPWLMHPAMFPTPVATVPATPTRGPPQHTPSKRDIPSSDPPDDTGPGPYPEIEAFIRKLIEQDPRRSGLEPCITNFDLQDYYYVDELAALKHDRLTGPDFRISSGNADFLLKEATKEVERVNRAYMKGKKRARHQ